VHRCSLFMGMILFWVFLKVAVLWQGGEMYRKEQACRFIQSVVESQWVKKQSSSQLQDSQWVKSYRTSKQLLFPLYIAWERTVLVTHFKIILTEVGQITQTVTTLYRPAFAHMNAHRKTSIEIHFIYLGDKEIFVITETCCIICFIFTKCHLFHNFIFSVQMLFL